MFVEPWAIAVFIVHLDRTPNIVITEETDSTGIFDGSSVINRSSVEPPSPSGGLTLSVVDRRAYHILVYGCERE